MAEGILRRLAAEKIGCSVDQLEGRGVMIASAGIAAAPGVKPAAQAVEVMQERGDDISNHAARPLSEKLVRHADLVLTLASGHRSAIVRRWPDAAARIATLRPDECDVDDPIGGPIEVYRQCANQIEDALRLRVADLDFS
jgi:protein-tyrosine phosphatase